MFDKYLKIMHIYFWVFFSLFSIVFLLGIVAGKIKPIEIVIAVIIMAFLICMELGLYNYFMKSIKSIDIQNNRVIFMLIKKSTIAIDPSECIKIVVTKSRYRFYLQSGIVLNCQKLYKPIKSPNMDYSVICKENFPETDFIIQ